MGIIDPIYEQSNSILRLSDIGRQYEDPAIVSRLGAFMPDAQIGHIYTQFAGELPAIAQFLAFDGYNAAIIFIHKGHSMVHNPRLRDYIAEHVYYRAEEAFKHGQVTKTGEPPANAGKVFYAFDRYFIDRSEQPTELLSTEAGRLEHRPGSNYRILREVTDRHGNYHMGDLGRDPYIGIIASCGSTIILLGELS